DRLNAHGRPKMVGVHGSEVLTDFSDENTKKIRRWQCGVRPSWHAAEVRICPPAARFAEDLRNLGRYSKVVTFLGTRTSRKQLSVHRHYDSGQDVSKIKRLGIVWGVVSSATAMWRARRCCDGS